MFWRPEVVVDDGGVRLVNVTRTIDLPWPSIQAIDTKWALTLITAYGRSPAGPRPAPGALAGRDATKQDTQHLPASTASAGGIRPGDLPTSASGSAAAADPPALGGSCATPATSTTRGWSATRRRSRGTVGTLAGGAVLAVLAVVGLLV